MHQTRPEWSHTERLRGRRPFLGYQVVKKVDERGKQNRRPGEALNAVLMVEGRGLETNILQRGAVRSPMMSDHGEAAPDPTMGALMYSALSPWLYALCATRLGPCVDVHALRSMHAEITMKSSRIVCLSTVPVSILLAPILGVNQSLMPSLILASVG